MNSRFKIFSDPVHGFISVPKGLLTALIQTPAVQRLRRVRQLGVGFMVFPGGEHTRFGHALGAMALMQDTLQQLAEKGTPISKEEQEAAMAAALLHDVGHGPFSHTLEFELLTGFEHEDMSRAILVDLNRTFGGSLELALAIFDDTYHRPFFHELVSSQLDMDRLDYLRRDAFYTGVSEGSVGVERIIKTMRVHPTSGGRDAHIVVEAKGTYAVENFLIARRLMYWQVYLHKTVLAGDHTLRSALRRVRAHFGQGSALPGSEALLFFLRQRLDRQAVEHPEVRARFCALDDSDVLYSLKQWMRVPDGMLADLSRRFIERDFFRVTFLEQAPSDRVVQTWRKQVAEWLQKTAIVMPDEVGDASTYYLDVGDSRHFAYQPSEESIRILDREGRLRELSDTYDSELITTLSRPVVKPYVFYPKEVELDFRKVS